jgi:hypothetical protein
VDALGVTAIAAVLLAGCTSLPSTVADTTDDDEPEAAASVAPTPTPTPSPSPAPNPSPSVGDAEVVPCDRDDRDEMAAAVRGQLAAITADDWEGALSYTSTSFRASVDATGLERIIVDGFPVVADAVGADVTWCLRDPTVLASLLVTVEDADGGQQDLVYLFELEDGAWRIGGAVPDEPGVGGSGGITA